jgi:acetyl-CoA carboxylase biotin carboxyl carrier protein
MNGDDVVDRHEPLVSLLEFAAAADLAEVEWEKDGRRVAFKRRPTGANAVPAAPANGAKAAAEAPAKPVGPKTHVVRSPMVGTFWRALKQDRPPLVLEGGEVTAGQRVAYVEAMKVNKDVLSDITGRILKILAENGKPVEYGQPLFEVEVEKG